MTLVEILRRYYGVNVLSAPPVALLWAANRMSDAEEAKRQLLNANAQRVMHGRVPAYAPYGSRLAS